LYEGLRLNQKAQKYISSLERFDETPF
jgi:hypothetical protein